MSKNTSQIIGDIFERASIHVFTKLFEHWGYMNEIVFKRQNSGTQFGFDIYFKLKTKNFLPINVFIECKASKSFNEIKKQELTIKSYQLNKSSFPNKDVHIYFSPTRKIKYENDDELIENDIYPFAIVDFTNKSMDDSDDIFKLFSLYEQKNSDVTEFFNLFESTYISSNVSFESISDKLKNTFFSNIKSFLSRDNTGDLTFMSGSYWNNIKVNT